MLDAANFGALSSIAAAISAIAAAASAYLSLRSIKANAMAAREQRASQAMLNYVDLSLKYKELSTLEEDEDYEWYVIAVLETARQVLTAYPTDSKRRRQMREQLEFHADQLIDWRNRYEASIADYGPDVEALVADVARQREKELASGRDTKISKKLRQKVSAQ
jgi:hypothetical protein